MFGKDGKLTKKKDFGKCSSIACGEGSTIYTGGLNERYKFTLAKIDTLTGKTIWKKVIDEEVCGYEGYPVPIRIACSKEEKCLYILSEDGISKYDSDGKKIGLILDFDTYTIHASGFLVSDFNIDSSKTIYITTLSREMSEALNPSDSKSYPKDVKYELLKYFLSPDTGGTKQRKVITLSIPSADPLLKIAASRFQRIHPECKIIIKEYANNGSMREYEKSMEKYHTDLNTSILTGKGPDIISVSGLPFEKYIAKNILEDVGSLIENDKTFDKNKYYWNIFDALKYNGSIYTIPVNFRFNVLCVGSDAANKELNGIDHTKWTWTDFKSVIQKFQQENGKGNSKKSILPDISCSSLLEMFLQESYGAYIDYERKTAAFYSPQFIDFISIIKQIGSKDEKDSREKRYLQVFDAAHSGNLVFNPEMIYSYTGYSFTKSLYNGKVKMLCMPKVSAEGGEAFNSDMLFAINKNSKCKAEAWEFLKYLLSDEIQELPESAAFSVNKVAQHKLAEEAIKSSKEQNSSICIGNQTDTRTLMMTVLTASDIQDVDKMISGLGKFSNSDSRIIKIINEETKPFFQEYKSAEDTAKAIQRRVDLYLGE